jgi:hypothetical protein
MPRTSSLAQAAREYIWLWDHRHGLSVQEIAAHEGFSVRRVRFGLSRAAALDAQQGEGGDSGDPPRAPLLIPMFPLLSYVPSSPCAHHGAIHSGSLFCCMVCHQSGIDGHPGLIRDPRTDPAPEPKPKPPPPLKKAVENRRQRRLRQFGPPKGPSPDAAPV